MNVYFRGAICRMESGAPAMIYMVIQKPEKRTRTIRITMGERGLVEFKNPQELFDDIKSQGQRPGHYYANALPHLSVSLGDLEMMVYQAIKEENAECER